MNLPWFIKNIIKAKLLRQEKMTTKPGWVSIDCQRSLWMELLFQFELFSPCIMLNNWSRKRINATFETFPVEKQGWCTKGQMLIYLMSYPKKKNLDLSGLYISKRINWIISKVQVSGKKNLASKQLPAALGSKIVTRLVFCRSFSV